MDKWIVTDKDHHTGEVYGAESSEGHRSQGWQVLLTFPRQVLKERGLGINPAKRDRKGVPGRGNCTGKGPTVGRTERDLGREEAQ